MALPYMKGIPRSTRNVSPIVRYGTSFSPALNSLKILKNVRDLLTTSVINCLEKSSVRKA